MAKIQMPGKVVCFIPECGRFAKSRGLCDSHYHIAQERVKSKELTWAILEQKGLASVPQRVGGSIREDQFDAALKRK